MLIANSKIHLGIAIIIACAALLITSTLASDQQKTASIHRLMLMAAYILMTILISVSARLWLGII